MNGDRRERPRTPRPWRLLLSGAGHVGRGFLDMLEDRRAELEARFGADLRVCGIAEYGGCVLDPDGLDLGPIRAALTKGEPLAALPGIGRPGMTPRAMVDAAEAEILLEATPVSLVDGEPGLGTVRTALSRGMHAVLANKGPLALAFRELAELADLGDGWGRSYQPPDAGALSRPRLRFSATVAGALPVVNIGRRDLAGDRITRIEAVFNGTSQSILRAMETGCSFADALADAQARGIAEADPALDVDGVDAACKLVITANAVLGVWTTLADVAIEGIRAVDPREMAAAVRAGERLVPLCLAELDARSSGVDGASSYRLSVRPALLPQDHPLARLTPDEMGVVFYTDHLDRLSGASLEPGPGPASAAMLRDVLDIVWSESC
jgi:homoserine dehydrogenase